MSIEPIDSMDAELMPTKAEANASVERAIDHAEGFWSEIQWQAEHKAWESLGYASFDELWERRYSSLGVRISREERPELVAALRGIGQTQQGIADKLGVSQQSVSNDLREVNTNFGNQPPTITNSRGQERPGSYQRTPTPANVNTTTGEIEDDMPESEFAELAADASDDDFEAALDQSKAEDDVSRANVASNLPTKVTGMDGKQYPRPEPHKPKRRPITDAFFEATYDLGKLVERIERLTEDDRFSRNKNEIAQSRKSDLVRAADTLDSILRQLD